MEPTLFQPGGDGPAIIFARPAKTTSSSAADAPAASDRAKPGVGRPIAERAGTLAEWRMGREHCRQPFHGEPYGLESLHGPAAAKCLLSTSPAVIRLQTTAGRC